ncbi:hypothetical protein UPYG_G00086610 [Umbra pygmaea]|uniref:Uncharacterized protein n=1 Tax=Umbra pygmaea TaxID=75934 RepID=A0ABD0XET6_UMBPY
MGDLPDLSSLDVAGVYADFPPETAPVITRMAISSGKPLVDSALGRVQAGSILSYQHPCTVSDTVISHSDAPPFPELPLQGYSLEASSCAKVLTQQEQLHLASMSVSLQQCQETEKTTRCQSETPEWYSFRNERETSSKTREVCHVRGQVTAENLASRINRGSRQTAKLKRGRELEGVRPRRIDEVVIRKQKPSGSSKVGIRSVLYKGIMGDLPDLSSLDVAGVYADFPPETAPVITRMAISSGKPLVDSALGRVQAGSILSYQHPCTVSDTVISQ